MPITEILTQEDIEFVSALVTEAGSLALKMRDTIEISWKTGPQDKVTTADFALSKLIVDHLTERFSEDTIISEEDKVFSTEARSARVWLIDPIDGTDNYISNDGQYSVMIGLVLDGQPVFGWVYAPTKELMYYGGPSYGSWRQEGSGAPKKYGQLTSMEHASEARLVIGWRDRKSHPWIAELPEIKIVKTGSIGLKVAKVLDQEADLFVHLSGKLKTWDTAGPAAIALGGKLEVGSLDSDRLEFPSNGVMHVGSVIMGRTGAIDWSRVHLNKETR